MSSFSRVAKIIPPALMLVLFGILICVGARQVLGQWMQISVAYSAIGVLWGVAGPAMVVAGVWALSSLGRRPVPLWIGGAAAALAGGSLVAGVLTYVIPCSGPS